MGLRTLAIFLTLVITSCLHFACTANDTNDPTAPGADPHAIRAAISGAEDLFRQREDVARLREAVEALQKVRDYGNRSFDVEWRVAKFNYFLGKQILDEDESDTAFRQGRDAAMIAVSLRPDKPEGHFWYGANLGELARRNMLTVGIRSIDDIRGAMQRVVELQPGYQNSSAYDVLGQIEMETRLYGGKAEKAIELFLEALENETDNINLHLHLGEAYLAVRKESEARRHLEKVLTMKHNPDYVIECREAVAKAKKLLATRF